MKIKSQLLLSLCLFFCCCATLKWQRKYINKHIPELQKKYALSNESSIKIPSSLFVDKPNSQRSRKEVKKDVAGIERIYALIPDSTFVSPNTIDTFYNNKNKIAYIKKNKLKTNNIHFLE